MKKTQFGATILEGSDIADLPLVSRNAQILEDEILKDRSKLEDKVDKVSGKGLSTNDFTNAHKKSLETDIPDKLSKLEQGLAGAGKVETVNNIKPDSNKNIKLTGTNIAYKDGVTENIATKISKMDTEIDTVKQSGVKSNKRISDKLNSLEIPASDKDNISINIGKFESITNQGKLDKIITTQNGKQIITPGYYQGGEVKAQFNNLVPENIKKGVNIGGVLGTVVQERKNAKGVGKMNRFEVSNLPFKPNIIFATNRDGDVFGLYVNLGALNNPAISGLINAGIFWERKTVQSYLFNVKDNGFIFNWSLTSGSADIYWYAYE